MTGSTNDARKLKDNITLFLSNYLKDTNLDWTFCTPESVPIEHASSKAKEWNTKRGRSENKGQLDSAGYDVYFFLRDNPNLKIRVKIHFVLNGKYSSNPPNYNLPYDVRSLNDAIFYLRERNIFFLVVTCHSNVKYPRMFYMDQYENIPYVELDAKSRWGNRIDRIQVRSHKWYNKKYKVVGLNCTHLLEKIKLHIKNENK